MLKTVRAILIDDELSSLQNLTQKLEEFCKQVIVVAAVQEPRGGNSFNKKIQA